MKETPTYAGIDVAKDRLDVMLRPSGEYVEATNDERGIRSVVRLLCVRRMWRLRYSRPPTTSGASAQWCSVSAGRRTLG